MRTPSLLVIGGPAVALVGALVALSSGGCDDCSGSYNCPNGETIIKLPANLSSPVANVTATAPCMYDSSQPAADPDIGILIAGERTGTCTVHVTLADGSELQATFSFEPLKCCGSSVASDPVTLSAAGP